MCVYGPAYSNPRKGLHKISKYPAKMFLQIMQKQQTLHTPLMGTQPNQVLQPPQESVSTKDLLSRSSRCNHFNNISGCVVGSMYVISPSPSIDIDFAVERCIEIICDGEVGFREINMRELDHLLKLSYDNNYLCRQL